MSDVAEAPFERFEVFGQPGPDSPVNPYPDQAQLDTWASRERVADWQEPPSTGGGGSWWRRLQSSLGLMGWRNALWYASARPEEAERIAQLGHYGGSLPEWVGAYASAATGITAEVAGGAAERVGEAAGEIAQRAAGGAWRGLGLPEVDKQTLIVAGVVLAAVLLSR